MIRRWFLVVMTAAFVWVVLAHFDEMQTLLVTLQQGQWPWIWTALLIQVGYFVVYAASFHSAFAMMGVAGRLRDTLALVLASAFVNTTAPTGGAAGAALFVDEAGRRGKSQPRAAMGMLVQLVTDFSAFFIILIVGLIDLAQQNALRWYELVAALVLVLYVLSMIGVLMLGRWRPTWLHLVLGRVQQFVNRTGNWMRRPSLLAADWSERNAEEFIGASHHIAKHPQRLVWTTLLGALSHVFGLASLYVIFLAFNQPVDFGVLVAGYSMIILFGIVSPTSNGAGVVEALMPVIFVSLGIPTGAAALVTISFRGISFWLPVLIGFILMRWLPLFTSTEHEIAESEQVPIAALATAAMGIINVLSAITPSLQGRLAILGDVSPLEVRHGGHLTAALTGFALLVLARGLWRRKQAAWVMTELVLLISIIAHLVKGLDYEEAILAAVLAGYLWFQRKRFHALSDPPSVRQGLTTLAVSFLFTLGYGMIGFYLLDRHFSHTFDLTAAARQTIVMFTQFYDPGLQPITGFGHFFAYSIYIVAAATFGYALWMLLQPVLLRGEASPAEHRRAQIIVERHGRTSLARFVLFPDKRYWFSPGGSVVAYAVWRRVAVALGDPVGPPQDVPATLEEFRAFCARNDWTSAFYQTQPDYVDHYREAGYDVLCIGNEAIVDLSTFTLRGGKSKSLRTTQHRLERLGYRAEAIEPPLSDATLLTLRAISDEWLEFVHGNEMRFSLGWFEDDYIRNSPVMVVYGQNNSIVAFANFITEYQSNEATVDLMRHRRSAVEGTMDFLFISLLLWAQEHGYATFNLGLSALSGVGEEPDDPALERALNYVYQHLDQFYNFKGLHAFKSKFHPNWSPRYLVFPNYTSLPTVGLALQHATSGSSFIGDYARTVIAKVRPNIS